jgi:hypothetical protein
VREHLTLHELAGLVSYWRQYPPTHVTLSALARSFTGAASRTAPAPRPRPADPEAPSPSNATGMEGVAAILGAPSQTFRRPCRMQTPAPDPKE